jgi:hypothetical protein
LIVTALIVTALIDVALPSSDGCTSSVEAEHRQHVGAVGGVDRPPGDDAGGPVLLQAAVGGGRRLRLGELAVALGAGRVSGPAHVPYSLSRPTGTTSRNRAERLGATVRQAAICTRRTRSARLT